MIRINLLSGKKRRRGFSFNAQPTVFLAVICMCLVILILSGLVLRNHLLLDQMREEREEALEDLEVHGRRLRSLERMERDKEDLVDLFDSYKMLTQKNSSWSDVLSFLGTYEREAFLVSSLSFSEESVNISGSSRFYRQTTNLVNNLEAKPFSDEVELLLLEKDGEYLNFRIECFFSEVGETYD